PGIHVSRSGALRRETARPEVALVRNANDLHRRVALRLLHHRYRRLDAAPGRLHAGSEGRNRLESWLGLIFNPWTWWQYAHNMTASVVTASFVLTGVGAFYLLLRAHEEHGRVFVRVGVVAGVIGAILMLFPTGDRQGHMVAVHQPVTLAAMEGHFQTMRGAPI